MEKLQAYDLSYFRGKQYFDEEDGKQNYLVFLPTSKYFKLNTIVGVIDHVLSWQYKGLSNESIKPPTTSNYSLNSRLSYYGTKIREQFTGSCLKQLKFMFTPKKVVNICIVYESEASSSHTNDPTLKNCLFGAVTLTKNDDIEKYGYSGYGIGFDRRSSFSFPSGGFGQTALIFGVDMSSSPIDNKKKDILVLGRGTTQGLEITLTAEKMYSINFTVTKKKFCLSLHYNGANSYLFVNGAEIHKFKAKDSESVASPLCLGNISKDWSTDNMKKTGFTGYVYDFSADYNAVTVDDIKDIHNYLMNENNIVKMQICRLIKKVFFLGLTVLSNFTNALDCISMKNREFKVRPEIININSNNPMFYPFSVKINRCSGNCNNINDPYAKMWNVQKCAKMCS